MEEHSPLPVYDKLFQIIADALPDAVVLTNVDFKIISWNRAAEKLYGYTPEEVLGRDISLLIPQDQHARERRSREAFVGGSSSTVLHRSVVNTNVRKDGSLFTGEISSFLWQEGEQRFYGAVIRDISQRLEAEKKIKEAKDFLETIFTTSPDGIIVTDKDGYIIKVNQAFLDMMGYTEGEFIGRHPGTFSPEPYDPNVLPWHIEQVFLNGFIKDYETKRQRKDGTILDVELSMSLLSDSEGNLKGMVSFVRDVTERKLLEKRREQLIVELQEALSKVKRLRGLLPICASCKRIRDDKGYWQQIETFIHEHSEAEFSHGLCPECMEKLYPEFFEKKS